MQGQREGSREAPALPAAKEPLKDASNLPTGGGAEGPRRRGRPKAGEAVQLTAAEGGAVRQPGKRRAPPRGRAASVGAAEEGGEGTQDGGDSDAGGDGSEGGQGEGQEQRNPEPAEGAGAGPEEGPAVGTKGRKLANNTVATKAVSAAGGAKCEVSAFVLTSLTRPKTRFCIAF